MFSLSKELAELLEKELNLASGKFQYFYYHCRRCGKHHIKRIKE